MNTFEWMNEGQDTKKLIKSNWLVSSSVHPPQVSFSLIFCKQGEQVKSHFCSWTSKGRTSIWQDKKNNKFTIKDLLVYAYKLITKGLIVNILRPKVKESWKSHV